MSGDLVSNFLRGLVLLVQLAELTQLMQLMLFGFELFLSQSRSSQRSQLAADGTADGGAHDRRRDPRHLLEYRRCTLDETSQCFTEELLPALHFAELMQLTKLAELAQFGKLTELM